MAYIPETLRRSMYSRRRELLVQQVEEAVSTEHLTEEVEEREFDEQERLRVHRTIKRDVSRSSTIHAYRQLAATLQASGGTEGSVREAVERRIEQDLQAAGQETTPAAIARYAQIIPRERWPRVLAAGPQLDRLKTELLRRGLQVDPASAAERLGVVSFACPPEESVLNTLGGLETADALEDPNASLRPIRPMSHGETICDHRALLRLAPGVSETLGDGVTIAILDTGIDRHHPAFRRVKPEDYRDFTGEGLEDKEGHGTHVASIAAGEDPVFGGRLQGIAPRARLVVARVLPTVGGIPLETMLEAMAWTIFEKRADLISMSIGAGLTASNGRSIWTRVCEEAVSQGAIVCVAAGNNDGPIPESISVPADARQAVTVGAIDGEGRLAEFSAMGSTEPESPLYGKPNSVAPGVNIIGAKSEAADFPAVPGTNGLYTGMTGTSMATPMVAGCLALIKSKALKLGWQAGPRELMDIYYAACHTLRDENGTPYSQGSEIGHGLVDMEQALALVESKSLGAQAPPHAPSPARAEKPQPRPPLTAAPPAAPQPQPPQTRQPQPPQPATAGVCAACRREYRSRVGVFSPDQVCPECGEPICKTCWAMQVRHCARHQGRPLAAAVAADAPSELVAAPAPAIEEAPGLSKLHTAAAFFNHFDNRARQLGVFRRPGSDREFYVDEKHRYEPVRAAGRVVQYECKAKHWFSGPGMCLSAIALSPEYGGETGNPPDDLLDQVAGRNGLDVRADQFHVVGIFCHAGWPEGYRTRDLSRANLKFLFVEPGAGPWWNVYPEESEFRSLYDPETEEQKCRRAADGMAACRELSTMGGSAPLEVLSRNFNLPGRYVEAAVEASHGRFRIVEHRGKKTVLRASIL